MFPSKRLLAFWLTVVLSSFGLVFGVSAQNLPPVAINTNTFGELTTAGQTIEFSLTVTDPLVVTVQVLSVTDGIAASFDIFAPNGVVLVSVANNGIQPLVTTNVSLSIAGTYRIAVRSSTNLMGQFLLTVLGTGEPIPTEILPPGQSVSVQVDEQNNARAYTFTSTTESLIITIEAAQPGAVPVVTLKNADTNTPLAINSAEISSIRYRLSLPAVQTNYVIEISYSGGAGVPQTVTICVVNESNAAQCGGESTTTNANSLTTNATATATTIVTELVDIPANGACQVATSRLDAVNIRREPDLNAAIIGSLSPSETLPVIGRLSNNRWYQVNDNGILGWVSTTVIRIGGLCGGVPLVAAPTTIAVSTTATVTATSTGATATHSSSTATATPTTQASPTATPTTGQTLNFSLPPTFGSMSLAAGFVPDPSTASLTGGGTVNVNYLGSACRGFTTSAPTFSVNYTNGAFPTLRFYFVGAGDTTMVINSPSGSYFCIDDSFGTLHPTLDFTNPASGRYDIWIGTFSSGGNISGTLSITENTGNHP